MKYTTMHLAEFICETRFDDIPGASLDIARRCLLDLIGSAAAGFGSPGATCVRLSAETMFAKGPAGIWFSGKKVHPAAAAWANSSAASALDTDDGHRGAAGHPGAGVIPAVLAVAGSGPFSGKDLLRAVCLGYEVAVRISAARDFSRQDTLSTGRWIGYGVVAAVSALLGFSKEHIAQALSISGVLSPNVSAAGYSQVMGNQAKEGIPVATFIGMTAMDLAKNGFTGPLDILDHPQYFDAEKILANMGIEYEIQGTYFKPYACCRWIHSALDAGLKLKERHGFTTEEIKSIRVVTFERALRLNNLAAPTTIEGAQYSIPFSLAAGLAKGAHKLLPMDEALLADGEILHLAGKVHLSEDPAFSSLFPEKTAARVEVETREATFSADCMDPLGDPANPMTWDDLTGKFKRLTAPVLAEEITANFIDILLDINEKNTTAPADILRMLS